MKTWGSWERVVASIGGAALAGGLLMVMASRHAGKHSLLRASMPSPTMAIKTAGLTQPKKNPEWIQAYGKLPLSFEENQGQTAQEVSYVSRGAGYQLFLTPQEAVLALRPNVAHDLSPLHRAASIQAIREARQAGQMTVIRMRLEGANPQPQIVGTDRLPTKVNYFIGSDPKKWRTDVPSYAAVKYADIYPGVDLVFYGSEHRLEYDFVVAPGVDPKAIALRVEGGRKMRINSRGDLVLSVSGGEVELRKPVVYQNVRGERREIAGSSYFIAKNRCVTFTVGSYDRSEPLIVDPVLNYSTYLGGSSDDTGFAIAVDTAGDAFVAGQTLSTDFPAGTHGAVKPPPTTNSGAIFVAELNPAGTQLLYSTYLVGATTNGGDSAFGIAVDSSGKAYVTGSTFATDFPTTPGSLKPGPLSTNPNGTAFVTKLDPAASGTASLVYSTYLGGTGGEFANAIAADAAGNAYVAGITHSVDFPTMNAFQSTPKNAFGTAFLAKLDPAGASLIYSTYLGGTATNEPNPSTSAPGYGEQAFGVAADSSNNAYLVGTTTSTDTSFITTGNAYQSAPPPGNLLASAFLSRIDTTKSANASLIYSTYLAGSTEDLGFAIALGPNNVAYTTGTTNSVDFPHTAGAFQTVGAASGRAFVSLVDTTGSLTPSLKYSTFLGGSGSESGFGIRADSQGNAYVAGTTASSDFAGAGTLKSLGAFQPALSNTTGNAFVAKLNPAGTGATDLLYATYFGGNGNNGTTTPAPDQGFGIAIDSSNPSNAYITGKTNSVDLPIFPNPGAFQTKLNATGTVGFSDAYVAKLTTIPTLAISPSSLNFGTQPVGVTSAPQTVTVTNNNNGTVTFSSISITGTNSADFSKATDTCSPSVAAGAQCTVGVTFTPSAPPKLNETAALVFTDNDVNSPQSVGLSGSAPVPAVGLAPTSLAFGNQVVNTTSAAKTETLTNTGTGPLTILSIAASGDFAEISAGASACPVTPATLAAGSNCTISVTFTPTATGTRSGTLTITDNASNSPQTVPLGGTGTAPQPDFTLSAAPTTLTVAQGAVGAPVTISVNPTNGFSSAVALTCMGAPTNSSCMLSPTSITPPTTSTLTFTAHAMFVPLPISKPAPPLNFLRIVPLFLALMLIFLLRSTQRLRARLLTVSAIVICVTLAACSGGNNSNNDTVKGTYPLIVTGTSGALSHTTIVTVTVN